MQRPNETIRTYIKRLESELEKAQEELDTPRRASVAELEQLESELAGERFLVADLEEATS